MNLNLKQLSSIFSKFKPFLRKSVGISLIAFITPISLFTQNFSETSKLVSKETTRKIAEIQCRSTFGVYSLFDDVSYYDVDGERSCDVYIYSKKSNWKSKSSLIDSIYYYRKVLHQYGDSIKNINSYFSSENQNRKLNEFRKQTDKYIKHSTRPHEFISIYTSPSQNHKPVMEYREGLPESYVMKYDIEEESLKSTGNIKDEINYYYFGPLNLFYSIDNDILVSINDNSIKVNLSDLIDSKFNLLTLEESKLDNLNAIWENVTRIKDVTTILPGKNRSSGSVPDVPNFRQVDWGNIFPAYNSCVVLSTGSVLGSYDDNGFWSICPFAWYEGNSNSNGGFGFFPGKNFYGSECNNDVHFGPETMLYDIALQVGYNFVNGGTMVGCLSEKISTHCNNYTDDYLNLSFSYNQDCVGGGHSYTWIKNEIDANRPMLIVVEYYSFSSSGGPYSEEGGHQVAIVSYDENHWVGGDPIGVYINGTYSYDVVWWDYDQIRSQNSEITCRATSGGSNGTWINAPTGNSPIGSINPGYVNFSWQDVNATLYRVQISSSSDFSSYLFDFTTSSTSSSKSITTPGTYYWRVVPKNSDGHWCHFNQTVTFQIEEDPEITLTPSSKNFGTENINECTSTQSFILQNTGGGTASGSVSLTGSYSSQFQITSGGGSFSLSTGQTKTVYVKFCPTSSGSKIATLYANGNSPCNDASSNLSGIGEAQPEISLTPSSHNFGSETVGDCTSAYTFTLQNTGGGTATGNVSVTGSSASQFYINSGGGSFSLGANQTKTITVIFCPTSSGNKGASLFANGNSPCNDEFSDLSGVGIENDPVITLTPQNHDFGSTDPGGCTSTYSFTLENTGGGTANGTTSLTGSNASDFQITSGGGSFSLTSGQTKTVYVKFCPNSSGSKTANLYSNGNSPCNDASSILSGTGNTDDPYITLTPQNYNFGSENPGNCTSTYVFTLENTGGGTANGTTSLTGSNISDFQITSGGGSFSLTSGQTKTIDIKFCPNSTGSKSANLFSNGNSPCNDASSSLSGTGNSSPTFTISGTILESDNTPVDGVTISFSNGGGSIITNNYGFYEKSVIDGYSGTSTPSKTNWSFAPASIPYSNVSSDISSQDYIGSTNCYAHDFDCDGDVDIVDITMAAYSYGTVLGDTNYNILYDMDSDGDVDIVDISIIAYDYGWSE